MTWQAQGYRAWFIQRLSAVYLLASLLFIVGYLFVNPVTNFEDWRSHFNSPVTNILVLLFFIAVMLHAWIGIRDVVIDYVHFAVARLVILILLWTSLMGLTIWVTYILFTLVEL